MIITIHSAVIPWIITVICIGMMIWPSSGSFHGPDFSGIFKILWIVPICIVWVIYFAIKAAVSGT